MSDSAKVSITLKAGPGFEVPWIVLYGDTIAEAVSLLEEAGNTPIATLAANAARSFQAQYAATGIGVTTVVSDRPNTAPNTPAAPTPAPTQANGNPACIHGARVYREAKPGSGKSWKAWFCPTAQGTPDQCSPEFLKDR